MRIKLFGVEIWMNEYETKCSWEPGGTCVESLIVAQLLDLTGAGERGLADLCMANS